MLVRPKDFSMKTSSGILSRSMPTLTYPWGVVKVLDMGLARTDAFTGRSITHMTRFMRDGNAGVHCPGTLKSHGLAHQRHDAIVSAARSIFLLTGQTLPFPNGTITEKLIQHQMDEPEAVGQVRRERLLTWNGPNGPVHVNEELLHIPVQVERIIGKLLQKNPHDRHQTPVV